jgi:hypothetical protein
MGDASAGRDRVMPAYTGGSLVNLVATIAGHFGVATAHAGLAEDCDLSGADRVVFLVCDALGALQFEHHQAGGALPGLARMLADGDARLQRLTSVFPSTTAAALSSIHTGLTPAEHGHLGFSVWLDHGPEVTDLLLARDRFSKAPRPVPVAPPPIWPRLASAGVTGRAVNAAAFADSALTRWHFAGAEYRSWYSANTLPSLIAEAVDTPGPAYVWAYWPEHDPVCHVHGPCSAQAADELAAFDLAVQRLVRRLSRTGRTVLLIAGDHGQRTLDPEQVVFLDQWSATPPAGDRTAAYLRAEPRLEERLAPFAEVVPMDRVWADGWFGGPPSDPAYRTRTGDLLALARAGRQFVWRPKGAAQGGSTIWRGGHGGWAPEEMLVPLITVRV